MHDTLRLTLVKPRSGAILLVEDDERLAAALSRLLSRAGYAVETATTAAEAFAKVTRSSFDAVFSDLNLAGASGIDVLDVVRAYDKDVPCVVMTAAPTAESAIEAIRLGVIAYLVKPSPSEEILRVAARAVEMRKTKRAATIAPPPTDEAFERAFASLRIELHPIATADRRISGFEAKVASDEPKLDTQDAIFAVAEKAGKLAAVRRRARDLAARAFAGAAPGRSMFIDVGASDLLDGDLFSPDAPLSLVAPHVVLQLRACATSPAIPMCDLRARVSVLRFLGFRIAICDIDAGASRLAQIAELAPEYVKLDAALVKDLARSLTRQRVVSALSTMCGGLGAEVVAEGVADAEERAALVRCGCTHIQMVPVSPPASLPGFARAVSQ